MTVFPAKLGGTASAWMLAGRVASPLTALVVAVTGVGTGRAKATRRAGELLRGRRTVVGPRRARKLADGRTIPPGIFSEHRLSEKMNLELDVDELDAEYLRRMGPKSDLAIVLKSLWARSLSRRDGGRHAAPSDHFNLFGVIVNNADTPTVLDTIRSIGLAHPNLLLTMMPDAPSESGRAAHVSFVNANNFNLALERPLYMRALRAADLVLPDGIGVKIALQMAGGSLRKNLNGTDLLPHLADLFAREDWGVFLLGAEDAVLARARANLERRFPQLRIDGMHNGYFKEGDDAALCDEINASGAAVLVIGMGTPRQEMFVARNADRLRLPLVFSMGGILDFMGEKNKRAPLWMRQMGLEWVFRLVQEPGRMWRRYLVGNPVFLWRVRRWLATRNAPQRKGT